VRLEILVLHYFLERDLQGDYYLILQSFHKSIHLHLIHQVLQIFFQMWVHNQVLRLVIHLYHLQMRL
jgi:hypothetical protein